MNDYKLWDEHVCNAEKNHWWYKARRKIITRLFLNSVTREQSKTILSVGIGSGAELSFLSSFGKVEGLDIDEHHVAIGKEKGFQVYHQDITQCSLPANSFDIIIAMDVLEHIEDDRKAYENIIRLLKVGGTLIVTVPAYQFLWSIADELSKHKRRYTKKTLSKLLDHTSMLLQKCSYYNFFLFPALAMRRLFFKKNITNDIKETSKWMNNLLYFIFARERFFLPYISFPCGGSLLAIVTKK